MTTASLWGALDSTGFQTMRLLLSLLWQSSIVLLAAGGLAWFLRRRQASVRHLVWVTALVAAPLVPLLAWLGASVGAPQARLPVMPTYAVGPVPVLMMPVPPPVPAVAVPPLPAPPPPPEPVLTLGDYPWALALMAYAGGAMLFLFLVLLGRYRISRWIAGGSVVTDERVLGAFGEAGRQLSLNRRPLIVAAAEVQTPLTIGALRPVVLLPEEFQAGLPEADLRAIALHECAHIRRRDPLVLELASLLRALLFFHPLVWLACRQVSLLAEQAADDAVLDVTGAPVAYARMLARLAEELRRRSFTAELAAGIVLSKSAFLRRVEAILSDRRDSLRRLSRRALALTILAALVSLFLAAAVPLAEKQDTESPGGPAPLKVAPEEQPKAGGVKRDIELLRRVAEGHKANKERILSWRGTATITFDNRFAPGSVLGGVETHQGTDEVVFIYDGSAQATRWNSRSVKEALVRDGQTSPGMLVHNIMVRDGAFYQLMPLTLDRQGNILRRILTIEKYQLSTFRQQGVIFHPMYYLTESGRDIHDWLMSCVEGGEGGQVSGTVSRAGEMVTFETRTGDTVGRHQFDLAKGCNLVNSLQVIGQSTLDWTFEYEEIQGVFLPKRMVRGIVSKSANAESVSHWEVEFVNQALNASVDSSEFGLERLGLEPGDWVRDTRSNTGYAFGIEGSRELSGVVVDLDGHPVENCQVSVRRADDRLQVREMTSGPGGAFHFERLPDGNLEVLAHIPQPGGGVITDFDRRTIPSGTKDLRLVLPVKRKAETGKPVSVGEQAPELVLESTPGRPPFSLATLKGKPVVVAFVSIYSRPCVKVLDDLKALPAEKGADKLAVIAVHDRTATPEEIEQFRKDHSIPFPIVRVPEAARDGWDSATFRAYGVTALPTVVRIDTEGKVESVGASLR